MSTKPGTPQQALNRLLEMNQASRMLEDITKIKQKRELKRAEIYRNKIARINNMPYTYMFGEDVHDEIELIRWAYSNVEGKLCEDTV